MYPLYSDLKSIQLISVLRPSAWIQNFTLLLLRDINFREDSISVSLSGYLKHSKLKFNVRAVTFTVYTKDSSLCVCEMLKTDLTRNKKFRDVENQYELY